MNCKVMEFGDFCLKQLTKLGLSTHKIQTLFLKQKCLTHFCMGQTPSCSCNKITSRCIITVDTSLIYYFKKQGIILRRHHHHHHHHHQVPALSGNNEQDQKKLVTSSDSSKERNPTGRTQNFLQESH